MPGQRSIVMAWLTEEEKKYAGPKFEGWDEERDKWIKDGQFDSNSEWWRQITQYIDRVRLFGIDTPKGRQAYMKFIATTLGGAEAMIRVFGLPPEPGHTSGEIKEWLPPRFGY